MCEMMENNISAINQENTCIFCEQLRFQSIEELSSHLCTAHTKLGSVCEYCKRTFYRSSDFEDHLKKHKNSNERLIKCTWCHVSFFNARKLIEHQDKHVITDGYNNGFSSVRHSKVIKTNLVKKNKVDKLLKCMKGVVDCLTDDRIVTRPIMNCNKTITRCNSTNEGLSAENTEKSDLYGENRNTLSMYSCGYCYQLFSSESFLSKHVLRHEKRFKYLCKYCNMRYAAPDKLFAHFKKIHPNDAPFLCELCDLTFKTNPSFSHHIKIQHNHEGIIKFHHDGTILYSRRSADNFDAINNEDIIEKSNEINTQNSTQNDEETSTDNLESIGCEKATNDSEMLIGNENCEISVNDKNVNRNLRRHKNVNKKSRVNKKKYKKSILKNITKTKNDRLNVLRKSDRLKLKGKQIDSENEAEFIDFEFLSVDDDFKNSKEGLESCDVCGAKMLASSIERHKRGHVKQKRFKCHYCKTNIKDLGRFNYHMKRHFEDDKLICVCGARVSTESELNDHRIKYHNKNNFKLYKSGELISNGARKVDALSGELNKEKMNDVNIIIKKISAKEAEQSRVIFSTTPIIKRVDIMCSTASTFPVTTSAKKSNVVLNSNYSLFPEHCKAREKNISNIDDFNGLIDSGVELKLVVSNPLSHLMKYPLDNESTKKSKKKCKEIDYMSIIHKSLSTI